MHPNHPANRWPRTTITHHQQEAASEEHRLTLGARPPLPHAAATPWEEEEEGQQQRRGRALARVGGTEGGRRFSFGAAAGLFSVGIETMATLDQLLLGAPQGEEGQVSVCVNAARVYAQEAWFMRGLSRVAEMYVLVWDR
jgi:hypothetical protein